MSSPPTNLNPIARLHQWASKKDFYSLLNDFFFVFGVLIFDWNPVLIILWYMIDQAFMGLFVILLGLKEGKAGWLESIAGSWIVIALTLLLISFYGSVETFVEDLKFLNEYDTSPSQIINPVIFPFLASFTILNHLREYQLEVERIRNGSYDHRFMRHYFVRYASIIVMLCVMVLAFVIIQNFFAGILFALVSIKALIRLYTTKGREWF